MRSLLLAAMFISLLACTVKNHQAGSISLAGMYKLIRIEVPDGNGKWQEEDWAKGGNSYILYDGLGHMMVQILPEDYNDFDWLKEEDAINESKLLLKIDSMDTTGLKAAVKEFACSYTYMADKRPMRSRQ